MVNTYGYSRNTQEEDAKVMAMVVRHHEEVMNKGYLVVMTSLVGSQNYDLDHEGSDVDTFSLVYPPLVDLANAKEPYAGCFDAKDGGHCEVKDIRLALNLLRKTSPNSVEYFTSKYKVYNPMFEDILKEYLDNNTFLWHMVHCNYSHMLYAMTGMAHQLIKRNMPAGKRFAHALRLDDMYYHFMNSPNAGSVLDLRTGGNRDLALAAKLDTDPEHEDEYNHECEEIAGKLDIFREEFVLTDAQTSAQEYGLALINTFQWKLFKRYLEETNK